MSKKEIDSYLAKVPQPGRRTLGALRKTILAVIPGAEECISYGIPAFRIDGQVLCGFAALKNHCSYFPFSGAIVDMLKSELAGYETEKGTIRFAIHKPLPASLVKKLIRARLQIASQKILAKTGMAKSYYENGIVQSQGKHAAGRMHGKWEWFRKDGTMMRSGEFEGGRQVGIWRTYNRAGKLVKETKLGKSGKNSGKRARKRNGS